MLTPYLERRLAASLLAMHATSDSCARLAQRELARSYSALISKRDRGSLRPGDAKESDILLVP